MTEIILASGQVKNFSQCGIKANNDLEAIGSWLNEYQSNLNTYVSYKKEVQKFLSWCQEKRPALITDLKKEDFVAYIKWLQQPELASGRVNKITAKAAPSAKAMQYNIRVINSLLNYLVEADYIYKNPLRLIKKIAKFNSPAGQVLEIKARILEDVEFKAVIATLAELPEASLKERNFKAKAKLIFSLLYHLGLRVNELSNARWDNFKIVQGRVWFFLIGKGGKPGQIPVNGELLEIIKQFREYQQKPIEISLFESEYILPSTKTKANLSTRRIREIVKYMFCLSAKKFSDPKIQAKLKEACPHDLRHLLASNLDTLGISIIDTKEILRHSSERTTEIYRNSKEAKRHAAIQGNVLGMNSLLAYQEPNYTEIKFRVACRKQDALSFNYFINAVVNLHLKRYTIINGINLEEIKKKFMQQAGMCGDLTIKFMLEDKLDESTTDHLKIVILRAGEVRWLKVRFF